MQRQLAAFGIAAAGALLGWAALAVQLALLIRRVEAQGGTLAGAVWEFAGYFTIWSNIVAASLFSWAVFRRDRPEPNPRMELAAAVSMAMVGIIYSAVLRALWHPQGVQKMVDASLHDIMPVLSVAFFLLRANARPIWKDSVYALIFPLIYCVYACTRGAFDGWYAYPFLDAGKLGAVHLILNIAGLALAFWVMALVLTGLAGLINKRTLP